MTPEKKNRAAVQLGKLGGSVSSDAKAAAVRENGKKGGRPRKDGTKPAVISTDRIEANHVHHQPGSTEYWTIEKRLPSEKEWKLLHIWFCEAEAREMFEHAVNDNADTPNCKLQLWHHQSIAGAST